MKCLVVLSHLMSEKGVLGVESLARAKLAIDIFKAGNFRFLVTIGWAYRSDCDIPISDVVRDYITQNSDIDSSSIISLPDARDTVGDAYFCLQFSQLKNVKELFVVTSDYHVYRTKMIFQKIFDSRLNVEVTGAKTDLINDSIIIAHEAQSVDAFNKTFSNTDFSEISSIYETLSLYHPFYNGEIYPKIQYNSNLIIKTNRFILRPININDANERYSEWLSNPKTSKFISVRPNLKELKDYVRKKIAKRDILFLAICTIEDKLHIGNIKYDPIDIKNKYALMGILIGDQSWWGKGAASEIITASAKYLKDKYFIDEIILGVKETNTSAIKAYKKIGFGFCSSKYIEQNKDSSLTMTLKTKSLY